MQELKKIESIHIKSKGQPVAVLPFFVIFILIPGLSPRVSAAANGATRVLVADVVDARWSLRGGICTVPIQY